MLADDDDITRPEPSPEERAALLWLVAIARRPAPSAQMLIWLLDTETRALHGLPLLACDPDQRESALLRLMVRAERNGIRATRNPAGV